MSVRTKLLAIVVGLPTAVLLLCLYLLMAADKQVYAEAQDLAELAAQSSVSTPETFGKQIVQTLDEGVFREAYVMRFAFPWTDESADDFWTARRYFDPSTTRITEPDLSGDEHAALRAVIQDRAHALANTVHDRQRWTVSGDEMVILPREKTRGREYAIFARLSTRGQVAEKIYWVMIGASLILALAGWWLVGKWVIHPVERLASAADALATGRRHESLPEGRGKDEIARTAGAFNRMAAEIRSHHSELEARVLEGLDRIERTEQHLVIAQRLTATGKLAAGLAHEINNPLGGMKNALHALQRGDLPPERNRLYLELVEDGLTRVEDLVQRFLRFTPREPKPERLDVASVLEGALAMARHALERAGVAVLREERTAEGEASVFGDPSELQQVFLNLFLNAADALAEAQVPEPRLGISVGRVGAEVVVRVEDNGPGMTEDARAECFDMFFTTKEVGKGSGLGLAVAHNIVTNHGGSIDLRTAPGEGATFLVYLPATES